jgi:hypothetical protein
MLSIILESFLMANSLSLVVRFPYYEKVQWYAALYYKKKLESGEWRPCSFELQGLVALGNFLSKMAVELENVQDEKIMRKRKRCIPESITYPRAVVQDFLRSLNHIVAEQIQNADKVPSAVPSSNVDLGKKHTPGAQEEEKAEDSKEKLAVSIFESYDPEFVETPPRTQDEDSLASKRRKRRGSKDSMGDESDQEFKLDERALKKVKHDEEEECGGDSGLDDYSEPEPPITKIKKESKKASEASSNFIKDQEPPQVPLSKEEKLALFRDLAATKKPASPASGTAATSSSGNKKKGLFKRLSSTLRKIRHG